jgi:hypothetical protein
MATLAILRELGMWKAIVDRDNVLPASNTVEGHLSSHNRPSHLGASLPGIQAPLFARHSTFIPLLHHLIALRQDHLNVARVAHIRVDSAVGSVCSPTLLGSLVDLDALNGEVAGVQALEFRVGFGIFEEGEKEFGRLDWMSCT